MRNQAAKYGVLYGGISVGLYLLFWLIKPELIFDTTLSIVIGFGLPLLMMYFSIKVTREEQEGMISFGEAIKASFLTFVIGSLIAILFQYVLFNFLDESLLDIQKEKALEMTESIMKSFGGSEEMMEEMRDELEDSAGSFSFGQAILGWVGSLIIPGIIFSLIMSAILKKTE